MKEDNHNESAAITQHAVGTLITQQLVFDNLDNQLEHQWSELAVAHESRFGHIDFSKQTVDLSLGQT